MDLVNKAGAGSSGDAPPPPHVEPWARDLVLAFEDQASKVCGHFLYQVNPRDFAAGQQILARSRDDWTEITAAIVCRLTERTSENSEDSFARWKALRELVRHILRSRLPW
jgi:hypothetical protein